MKVFLFFSAMLLFISCNKQQDFPYENYFQNNYSDCRQAFEEVAKTVETIKIDQFEIDYCYYPAKKEKGTILVLTSGIHGIEGFAGSALQQYFLDSMLTELPQEDMGYLIIHGINPWGFENYRRVNGNNVDLNRNFSIDSTIYRKENDGYLKVDHFLNPQQKVDINFVRRVSFPFKVMKELRKASMEELKQAVLEGQYKAPSGLFYGGNRPEKETLIVSALIDSLCAPYQKTLAIDIHTGYGATNTMHLFPNADLSVETKAMIQNLYEGYEIDWGDKDGFYNVTGDFSSHLIDLLPGKKVIPMVFEFGTINNHKTVGSLKSIRYMKLENQGHFHGYYEASDSLLVKEYFMELYYPESKHWRNGLIKDGASAIRLAINNRHKI